MIVSVNGVIKDKAGVISAGDRAFLLGDGVFETLLLKNGAPVFFDAHLARLRRGLGTLGITEPATIADLPATLAALDALEARDGDRGGYAAARVTISRGDGPRGLKPIRECRPVVVVSVARFIRLDLPAPARLALTERRRFSTASTVSFKAIGAYLENMLADVDAGAAGGQYGVMLNEFGRIACASTANIFVVTPDGALLTPALSEGALPGVVRAVVLEDARSLGVAVRETMLSADEFASGDVFLTNSLIGLMRARLTAASDHPPSDIFRALKACYERRLDAFGRTYH
jgi:branched-chain amino acid aminotransferase